MITLNHRPISIAEQIFDRLEKDILRGRYERGEILSELKLSEELGVSRTPVREALSRLVQERLLEDTGKGLRVIGITKKEVLDMYEIRIQLAGMCASLAAENATPEQISEMKEAVDMQRFHLEKQKQTGEDRSEQIKDMDSRFHELLHEASGSGPLRDVLQSLHKRISKYRKASLQKRSRAEESVAEHETILAAIAARDSDAAAEAAVQHIRNAKQSIASMQED